MFPGVWKWDAARPRHCCRGTWVCRCRARKISCRRPTCRSTRCNPSNLHAIRCKRRLLITALNHGSFREDIPMPMDSGNWVSWSNIGWFLKRFHLAVLVSSRFPREKRILPWKAKTKYYLWASFHDIWLLSKSLELDTQKAISAKKIMIWKSFLCKNRHYIVVVLVLNFHLSARSSSFFFGIFSSPSPIGAVTNCEGRATVTLRHDIAEIFIWWFTMFSESEQPLVCHLWWVPSGYLSMLQCTICVGWAYSPTDIWRKRLQMVLKWVKKPWQNFLNLC